MKEYWVLAEGSEAADGPYNQRQLAEADAEGRWITPPLVCEVGQQEWTPLTDAIGGLSSGMGAAAASPRPQAESVDSHEWSTSINLRYVSSHPIVKLMNLCLAVIDFVSGTRRTGVLTAQVDRILVDTNIRVLWRFPSSSQSLCISRDKITGVEIGTTKSFFFFRSNICRIFVSGVTVPMTYEVQCSYEELQANAGRWVA